MKPTLLILAVAAVVATTAAYPERNTNINIEDLRRDIVDGVIATAISRPGIEAAENFAENLRNAKENIIRESENLASAPIRPVCNGCASTEQDVKDFLASVQAFRLSLIEESIGLQNRVKRRVLVDIERELEDVYRSTESLQVYVEKVREKTQQDIAKEEQSIVATLNNNVADLLDDVGDQTDNDDETLKQAEQITNEYVNRYSNYLSSCADQFEIEALSYEADIRRTTDNYQSVVNKLSKEVENCLKSADTSAANRRCDKSARSELRNLRRASSDFTKLTRQGEKLLTANYAKRSCVVQTLSEARRELRDVNRKLKKIVQEKHKRDQIEEEKKKYEDENKQPSSTSSPESSSSPPPPPPPESSSSPPPPPPESSSSAPGSSEAPATDAPETTEAPADGTDAP